LCIYHTQQADVNIAHIILLVLSSWLLTPWG